VVDVDFDAEAAARVEFVRVQVSWNVENSLRFQRNFQFQTGVNTLLRFRYERLRGFCEVCGMLTHESGACLILNAGADSNSDGDGDEDMPNVGPQNQGVVIREIEDGEENGGPEIQHVVDAPDEEPHHVEDIDPMHNSLDEDDDLQDYQPYIMYNAESDTNELFNPIPIFENATGDIPGDESYSRYSASIHPRPEVMDQTIQTQEAMTAERGKRKREDQLDHDEGAGDF